MSFAFGKSWESLAVRRLVLVVFAVAAALSLEITGASTGYAQSAGPVSGVVVNRTLGGAIPVGLDVFFLATDESGNLLYSNQSQTGPDGGFSFQDVPFDSGARYLFYITYLGIDYNRVVSPAEVQDVITLTVFETTHDVSVIQVSRQVLVITGVDPKTRTMSALELVRFSNHSDLILDPSPDPNVPAGAPPMSFIRFSLPAGASDLNVNSDLPAGEVISVGTGFAVTSPIAPGNHNVEFTFIFPYDGDDFSYRQNLLQGAGKYQLMVPEELGSIDVSPLDPVQPVNIEGTRYRVWELNDLAARQGFTLELTNLPQPSLPARLASSVSSVSLWLTVIPIMLGVGLASALVLGVSNRGRFGTPGFDNGGNGGDGEVLHSESPGNGPPATREDLVLEMALLDRRFELGQTPPEDYNATRQALKARIMDLSRTDQTGDSPTSHDAG